MWFPPASASSPLLVLGPFFLVKMEVQERSLAKVVTGPECKVAPLTLLHYYLEIGPLHSPGWGALKRRGMAQ